MKRCNICRQEVYRGFGDHVRMHQMAARRAAFKPLGRLRFTEPLGVGTEIRPLQAQAKPGFWSRIVRWLRNALQSYTEIRGRNPSFM